MSASESDQVAVDVGGLTPSPYARTSAEYPADTIDQSETNLLLDENAPQRSNKKSKLQWLEKLGLEPSDFTWKTWLKAALIIALLAMIITFGIVFHIQDRIKDVLKYIEKNRDYGIIIYISVYTVCVWSFLPGSIISIAAGFLFKPLILAGAIIVVGDLIGAFGTFIVGRYIFSDWVKKQIDKRPAFLALNSVIAEEGWKIVLMLRLTPIPFNLISYFFSVSSIKMFPFLWATAIGVLPGTFNAVWIGSLVKSLSGIDQPKLENKDIVVLAMNFIFVGCCIISLSVFGKRSLRKAMYKLQTSKGSQPEPSQDGSHPTGGTSTPGNDVPIEEEPLAHSAAGGDSFTRPEKIILYCMLAIAILNLAICLPLYFYYRDIEKRH